MAFPWLFQENTEDGTSARWSGAGSNGNSKLNVRHYSWLAKNVAPRFTEAMPYRGASALHCDLSLGTADAYIQEDTAADMSATNERWVRFYFFASSHLTMAASDRFSIFQLQSAGPVSEASIDIRNNAGQIEVLASETEASATVRASPLILNAWHCLEMGVILDSGALNGTIDFFVDGYPISTQIATLTQAAVVQARLGAMNIDAGTTAGHLLFDEFVLDDARVYPHIERYPLMITLTQSSHVAVGPGRLGRFAFVTSGSADCKIAAYDTDDANILASQSMLTTMVPEISIPANVSGFEEFSREAGQGYFSRGLYISMAGTNPRAQVWLDDGSMSPDRLKDWASKRKVSVV